MKRLSLSRETLTDLTPGDLTAVAGGTHLCWLTDHCLTGPTLGGGCPSINASCPTFPVGPCVSLERCYQTG